MASLLALAQANNAPSSNFVESIFCNAMNTVYNPCRSPLKLFVVCFVTHHHAIRP